MEGDRLCVDCGHAVSAHDAAGGCRVGKCADSSLVCAALKFCDDCSHPKESHNDLGQCELCQGGTCETTRSDLFAQGAIAVCKKCRHPN